MIATHLASIRFAGDLPVWIVLTLALLAFAGVVVLYRRETNSLARPYSYLLPALRATAVGLVVLMLAGPVWHHRQVVGTLGRVVFAVDTSHSMSLGDSRSGDTVENRLQRASGWLLGNATRPGWLESIANTHAIDVVRFDSGKPISIWSSDDGTPIPQTFDWAAEGSGTDLTSPLSATLSEMNLNASPTDDAEETDSVRRAAVVIMSDGRQTESQQRSAPAIAKQLSAGGTTVNTLGFGSVDEPPDVGIVEVIRPETVAAEGKLAGQMIVKRFGGAGKPVTVRIEADGQTVWQRSVTFSDTVQMSVPFEIDVGTLVDSMRDRSPRGIDRTNEVLRLVAKVDADETDFTADNNSAPFRVAASTRNRRLLIMDGSSRWETRYLKNLFARDPAWHADVLLFGPGTSNPKLPRGDQPGQFPSTAIGISQYDAIVIGEIDVDQLTTQDRDRIVRFVAAGGGLVIIDGRHQTLRSLVQSEFGELMPVRYLGADSESLPKHLHASSEGLEQPALGLIDQSDQLADFWQSLPAPKWSANVELTEGAESWAETVFEDGHHSPWLATRMYGAGRVFYFASDQTWRWRYKVADRFHARFWNQLVVAAMEPPYSASDQFVSIGTDKVEYRGGESIAVRARLRDVRGNPMQDATVDAIVMQEGNIVASVPLSADNPTRGTYAGSVPSLPTGEYSIRIRASGFDESALLASTPVWVAKRDNSEMRRMSLDEDSLRQIAAAGAGVYVHESDSANMLEHLKPLSSGTVIESDTVLWQSYLWFCSIIGLLAIEWWCRKRAGLV
ncbi:hypothetical protein NHH03_03245 [Stieleria sp. TO1_6]|uniref:DUF7408 domain-containing protein n=1 Tax=Stieleria tagensis TaxID=2956795 RepID=UPI00209A6715|nr:hypothetical protein [Stieleria tagensis]MCO8120739.1 hypothetical protein [Stieleria tagensis]